MPTLLQRPPVRPRTTSRWWLIPAAVLLALALLAGFLFLVAVALPYWPRHAVRHGVAPITLMVQPAEPTPTPPQGPSDTGLPRQPDYMRTIDRQKSDTPPPEAPFQSDKNTLAAAEKPAVDPTNPLPSQDGQTRPEAFDFDTTPPRPGPTPADAATNAAPAAEPAPPPPTPAPKKTTHNNKKTQPNSEATPTPQPQAAQPSPTPGELPTVRAENTPSDQPPAPRETPPPDAVPTPPPPPARPPSRQSNTNAPVNSQVTSPGVVQPPGYQPQTVQTKMNGGISNTGRSAVNALGTPLGRYEKAVSDAIGARWYYEIDQNMSNLVHTESVKMHFYVTRSGRIVGIRATGSNPTSALATVSFGAVADAELPPMPDNVAELLPDGQLEVDYTFEFNLN